jgi:hypothetical protein
VLKQLGAKAHRQRPCVPAPRPFTTACRRRAVASNQLPTHAHLIFSCLRQINVTEDEIYFITAPAGQTNKQTNKQKEKNRLTAPHPKRYRSGYDPSDRQVGLLYRARLEVVGPSREVFRAEPRRMTGRMVMYFMENLNSDCLPAAIRSTFTYNHYR